MYRGLSIVSLFNDWPSGTLTIIVAGTVSGGTVLSAAQSQKGARRVSAASV